jgi:hypothetical protein
MYWAFNARARLEVTWRLNAANEALMKFLICRNRGIEIRMWQNAHNQMSVIGQ